MYEFEETLNGMTFIQNLVKINQLVQY